MLFELLGAIAAILNASDSAKIICIARVCSICGRKANLNNYICITCGMQFAETTEPPKHCPICEDERQYVGHDGQQWTTLAELQQDYSNCIKRREDNLYGIGTQPKFAIGQRALLIKSERGNVLWDCISLINNQTIKRVEELGGISAIAISHPHYYASAVEWANAFGVNVYLHEADREWVMRPDPSIKYWSGKTFELHSGITLINVGGHFKGGTVCHWALGTNGLGALLTGDIIQVVADRRWVSFMYSYPNLIPLSISQVRSIVEAIEAFNFNRIYGAWWDAIVSSDAKARVRASAQRYIHAIQKT